MKLTIKTLTGDSFNVEVEDSATTRDVKKEIFKSGKIKEAVRILKGQEMLLDGSTLQQHNITEGSTVNIVIEPEKEISIIVYDAAGILILSRTISTAETVKNIKEKLEAEDEAVIPPTKYDLAVKLPGTDQDEMVLDEVTMPLHYFGICEDAQLYIQRKYQHITIYSQKGAGMHFLVPKETKVGEIRQKIERLVDTKGRSIEHLVLFTNKRPNRYAKLDDDDATVGESIVLGNVWFLENVLSPMLRNVTFDDQRIVGIEVGDTVLSIKLRGQDQYDIPACRFRVKWEEERFDLSDYDVIEDTKKYYIWYSTTPGCDLWA